MSYIKIAIIPTDDPVLGEWEDWSMCTVSCGEGTRFRNRTCTPGGPCPDCIDDDCDCGVPLSETEECSTPLGKSLLTTVP